MDSDPSKAVSLSDHAARTTLPAVLMIAFLLFSCRPDMQTVESLTRADDSPIESTFDMELVYTEAARIVMTLSAPRMDRYEGEENYLEMPEGMEVFFFDSLMNVTSRMSARYAISYDDRDLIEARNDVVVVNERQEKLNTEQLTWDRSQGIIFSEKFVRVTTEDEVIYGDGLEADERFDQWEIKKPRGTFLIEDRPD